MESPEDIIQALMKPAKDLAGWSFPFSEILENYYAILNESCDFNFGKAALVLQNAVNVYGRRVEYLYEEIVNLNQSVNEKKNNPDDPDDKKERKKYKIDFSSFDFQNFTKSISNSTTLKSEKEDKQKVKLLNKRLTQLESISRTNKDLLDAIDVNNEVISKKVDSHCQQQQTLYKMLVDELIPDNLKINEDYEDDNYDYISNKNIEACDVESDCDNFGETEIFSSTAESGYSSLGFNSTSTTPRSRCLMNEDTGLNETPSIDNKNETNDVENHSTLEEPALEQDESMHGEDESMNDEDDSPITLEKDPTIRNSIETDAGYKSGDSEEIQSNTPITPTSTPTKNNRPEETFKIIPFESNVPNKLPKSRAEFKLPCHISLLKNCPKKRRWSDKIHNNTSQLDTKQKKIRKSQQQISQPKDERTIKYVINSDNELLGFNRKVLPENNLRNNQPTPDDRIYLYLVNSDDEFLGFNCKSSSTSLDTSNTTLTTPTKSPIITSTPITNDSRCSSPTSYTYFNPHSPESFIEFDPADSDYENNSFENHQKRIEEKMEKLKKDVNSKNDFEEEMDKWYNAMDSLKLMEQRPSFDVNEYENIVINSLKEEEDHQANFFKIADKKPEDAARLFLASLHLANTYNVNIHVGNSNNIKLTLLNADNSRKI